MKESQLRTCPICKSESQHLHLEENFQIENLTSYSFASRKEPEPFHLRLYLCESCELIYANPALPQSMIEQEYKNAAFDSSIEAAYAAKTYCRYLPNKSSIKSALDIGTGGGEFLLELQKCGVKNLHGIEPSISSINTAQEIVRSCIKQGFFSKELYEGQKFDLISCFQTLEHVSDPLKLSQDVYSLLEPNGRFFTVSHNFQGLVNRLLGVKSPIYDVEHLQLFSPKSLQQMLENSGFREIKIFPIINNYPLFYWIKLLPLVPKKKQLVELVKKIKIGYLPITLPIGNLGAIAIK